MEQKLIEYKKAGFLDSKTVDGNELLHLATPCRFRITETIVSNLTQLAKNPTQNLDYQ